MSEGQRKILVVDVGGSNVKILATGETEKRKFASGPDLGPREMVEGVLDLASDWEYEVVSIGIPGPVRHGRPTHEPVNLGTGWVDFDYEEAFGVPVRVLNDAAMQALGSYPGSGKMLFLGLGTGLGTAMVEGWHVHPMELQHLPYRDGKSFEDFVGERGREWLGEERWREAVWDVVAKLHHALQADCVVVGGGNAKRLEEWPEGVLPGDNENAFEGGFHMWDFDDP